MICGWAINLLQTERGWAYIPACRTVFLAYSAIGAIKFILSMALSHRVEAEVKKSKPETEHQQPSEASETQPLLEEITTESEQQAQQQPERKGFLSFLGDGDLASLVIRLFILFGLDSFASGLASLYVFLLLYPFYRNPKRVVQCFANGARSWMTYFFKRKFSLPEGKLGSIFFTTSIISAGSMLIASSIAKRIGNVRTMVFTHLPSAIFLALMPVPSLLPLALTFLVLRACSQNMDVAPRSAFLAAALPSDKRTAIMGSINVVKTSAQSMGPLITGVLSDRGFFGASFILAGILKCIYDIGILISFVDRKSVV